MTGRAIAGPASTIGVPGGTAWPIAALAWTALLLAVFVPLCTARYARR